MSVYGDILTAVQQVVQGLSLPNLPDASIRIRKQAVYLAEHDPVPLLVISPVLESQQVALFSGGLLLGYEVRLTVYHETGISWEDLDWLLELREDLRQALHVTTLSGASTVFDALWNPNPVYDVGVLPAGVDVTRLSFIYSSAEGRTG